LVYRRFSGGERSEPNLGESKTTQHMQSCVAGSGGTKNIPLGVFSTGRGTLRASGDSPKGRRKGIERPQIPKAHPTAPHQKPWNNTGGTEWGKDFFFPPASLKGARAMPRVCGDGGGIRFFNGFFTFPPTLIPQKKSLGGGGPGGGGGIGPEENLIPNYWAGGKAGEEGEGYGQNWAVIGDVWRGGTRRLWCGGLGSRRPPGHSLDGGEEQ